MQTFTTGGLLLRKVLLNSVFVQPEEGLWVLAATMSPGQEPVFPEYETDTSQTSKLLRKFKETPFVPIGKLADEAGSRGSSSRRRCSPSPCEQEVAPWQSLSDDSSAAP